MYTVEQIRLASQAASDQTACGVILERDIMWVIACVVNFQPGGDGFQLFLISISDVVKDKLCRHLSLSFFRLLLYSDVVKYIMWASSSQAVSDYDLKNNFVHF